MIMGYFYFLLFIDLMKYYKDPKTWIECLMNILGKENIRILHIVIQKQV